MNFSHQSMDFKCCFVRHTWICPLNRLFCSSRQAISSQDVLKLETVSLTKTGNIIKHKKGHSIWRKTVGPWRQAKIQYAFIVMKPINASKTFSFIKKEDCLNTLFKFKSVQELFSWHQENSRKTSAWQLDESVDVGDSQRSIQIDTMTKYLLIVMCHKCLIKMMLVEHRWSD